MTQASKRTHRLAVAAMLSAVAAVLQFVEFSIPLIPSFVKLDISDLPALLGTFSLARIRRGDPAGEEPAAPALRLQRRSGRAQQLHSGVVFVLCAGLVYRKHKSRKGALIGAMLGAVLMAVVSVPSNYFFVYPAYVKVYGMPLEAIIGAYQAILGTIAEALLQRSAQLPAGVQRALHLLQGLLDVVCAS